jgi:hypothetical protein
MPKHALVIGMIRPDSRANQVELLQNGSNPPPPCFRDVQEDRVVLKDDSHGMDSTKRDVWRRNLITGI